MVAVKLLSIDTTEEMIMNPDLLAEPLRGWRCPICNHNKGLYTRNVKELREEFDLMEIEGVEPLGHKRKPRKKKAAAAGPTGVPEYR